MGREHLAEVEGLVVVVRGVGGLLRHDGWVLPSGWTWSPAGVASQPGSAAFGGEELRAEDESDTSAWKRFRNDAVLSVDYIGKPNTPIYVGLIAGSGEICSADENAPTVVSDPTPALTAITETVWGGEAEAQLRIAFQTEKEEADGSWTPVKANAGDANHIERPSSGYVGDNVKVTSDTPGTLEDGATYRFRAWTKSFAGSLARDSAASADCYFRVDTTAPRAPGISFKSTYSVCTSTSCVAGGMPGKSGLVQLTSGGDVVAFQYKLSTSSTWKEVPGKALVMFGVTPPVSGTMKLSAKAKDSLGRWGDTQVVDFVVKEGPGPVGHWNFDEYDGQALDTSTTDPALRENADLSTGSLRPESGRRGGVKTPAPHEDRTLQLNGSGQYAVTSKPVIDTRSSFTVAGWVRLDRTDKTYSMVGQAGQNMSGVAVTAFAGEPWSMQMAQEDTIAGGASTVRISGRNVARAGVWTHIAATYDESTDKARLYVNGQLQGEALVANPIASTGPMTFGAIKYRGAMVDFLPGRVDEVKAWQSQLSDLEVKQDASLLDPATGKPFLDLAGAWDLSQTGPVFADTSGNGRPLTATTGTTVNEGALKLNGTTQAATAAGPVVDDSGSFTVTAEAKLDNTALLTKPDGYKAQVIGQRTATGSSWSLWFEKSGVRTQPDEQDPTTMVSFVEGTWHFGRLTADGTGTSAVSDGLAVLNAGFAQVTGVHNAQDGTITLYVGAAGQGQPKAYTVAVGTGELAVGKGFTDSAWGNFLPGEVKGMRLWSGAVKDAQQVSDVVFGAGS
ncbi:LamG domain-containing protein [Streptomyces sp. ICC4]|uniref:LamG domain-containing protein n=1 Tax=Streptomyces sp. ICC4 TaxID=2099584 RepID=UPI0013A6967D|nr:LamG domain-containing protein [Streptomyces sp. ICC4]